MIDRSKSNYGYGFSYTEGVAKTYKYGYKSSATAYKQLRLQTRGKDLISFRTFKIDGLGYHEIQSWERI